MKRTIMLLLAVLLMTGCSRETQVWLPEEEAVVLQGKDIVRIPMEEETEAVATEPLPEPSPETVPTEAVVTENASITKKPAASSKKNNSTGTTAGKETVSGSEKPVSTEPPATEPPTYDITGYQVGSLEYEMLERINEHRAEAQQEPLRMDTRLCAIASYRCFEASLVWSHTRPDGRGFGTVLDDYGYAAEAVKELMVFDSGSGDGIAMAERWMESETQKELLLDDYTTAGIGAYRVDGITYVTCLLTK